MNKKLIVRISRTIFAFFFAFHAMVAQCSPQQPLQVSMLQLIATPERYEGKKIRVTAFLHLEFEGDAIYLHREDYANAIASNSIAIELTDVEVIKFKKFQNSYVLIEGQFASTARGHFGAGQGLISRIARLEGWKVRRK